MFHRTGKVVVALVLIAGVALVALLYFRVIEKQLKQEAGDPPAAMVR
jgi:hypothetical protein